MKMSTSVNCCKFFHTIAKYLYVYLEMIDELQSESAVDTHIFSMLVQTVFEHVD